MEGDINHGIIHSSLLSEPLKRLYIYTNLGSDLQSMKEG
jgi:hypothetical protein